MYCPSCKDEFVEGIKECPDCKVTLLEQLAPEEEGVPEYVELVTVLSTGDSGELMVAKSLLEGAGIRCYAKGEGLQDLFGLGRIGTGFNLLVGPVQLQVAKEDAEEALMLLKV